MLSKEEIADKLRLAIESGDLVSRRSLGVSYPEINRMIAKGELFVTSCESVLARAKSARDEFEDLVSTRRVMDANMVRVHKGLLTIYAINKECADGKMLRFPDFGKMCPLFID